VPAHAWLLAVPPAVVALILLGWVLALRARLRGAREALRVARERTARDQAYAIHLASRAVSELERPVKLLGASLDLALRRRRDIPELSSALEEARREVDRLTLLAGRILLLVEPRRERAQSDLILVVKGAQDAVREQAASRQVVIALDGPRTLAVAVDSRALGQALVELLSNAIRVSRFGSKVRVAIEDAGGGRSRVRVKDEGPGFGNALPEAVFEPFLYHRTAPAAGIGLALARKVAREHGGDVTLERVGSGAEVVLEIAPR
jgi:signal transduction histidine kinase